MSIFNKLSSSPILRLLLGIFAIVYLITQAYIILNSGSELVAHTIFNFSFSIPWWLIFGFNIIACITIISLIRIINFSHRFAEGSNFSMIVFFFIALTSFPDFIFFPEFSFVAILALLVLFLLLKIYNQPNVTGLVFGASILGSLATFFVIPSIVLAVVIVSCIAIFRPFNLRNYVFVILGFTLPYFYLLGLGYIFDFKLNWEVYNSTPTGIEAFNLNVDQSGAVCLVVISFLAIIRIFGQQQKMVVRQRNQISIIFIFLLMMIGVALFYGLAKTLLLILIPLSICFHFYYNSLKRKWIIETVLSLIFLFNTYITFFN